MTGLDPSLTGFGLATVIDGDVAVATLKTQKRGHERLDDLLCDASIAAKDADLVIIEGVALYVRHGGTSLELAGLSWLVRHRLWECSRPYAVIPPSVRKKWLTANGSASKSECLAAAIKRFPAVDIRDDNQADALTLAAMGAAHLGVPLVKMPASSDEQLAKIAWPDRYALQP